MKVPPLGYSATISNETAKCKSNDTKQPLLWRIMHGTIFLLGSLCFIAGSSMYFTTVYGPSPDALVAGGWLFTVGSLCFLMADLQEWSHYLKVYWFCCRHSEEYEQSNAKVFRYSRSSFLGFWERSQTGINVFVSVSASISYLIGSIFFIPASDDYLIAGDWLFIVGSALMFLSQCWKVYRTSCRNPDEPTDHKFRLSNLFRDKVTLSADVLTGLGGICYLVGTILFLPPFLVTDSDENRASLLFLLGGVAFTVAAMCLQYVYYCKRN